MPSDWMPKKRKGTKKPAENKAIAFGGSKTAGAKKMPARSNRGGAVRGKARAMQVGGLKRKRTGY